MSRTRSPQQDALIDDPSDRKRRVELALDRAIRASRKAGALDDADSAAYTLARELARTVDYASAVRHDPYAVAAASRELREVLASLRLTPASRGAASQGTDLMQFLSDLATPAVDEA